MLELLFVFMKEEAVTDHPNTMKVILRRNEKALELVGISIGGGKIEIIEMNGFKRAFWQSPHLCYLS